MLPFCWPQHDLNIYDDVGGIRVVVAMCLPAAPFAMFHLFSEAPCRSIEACMHPPSFGAKTESVDSNEARRMRRALA